RNSPRVEEPVLRFTYVAAFPCPYATISPTASLKTNECAAARAPKIGDSPESRCGNTRYRFRGAPRGAAQNCSELRLRLHLLLGIIAVTTVRPRRESISSRPPI